MTGETTEPDLIKKFTDIISHRGPDDDGFYFYNNIALGHRRLSILDLSSAGHQPMPLGLKYTIVFNGEIYNYIEIKQELINLGYSFASGTDTEVILAAYDYWKETCVSKFNGMWSFVLLDKTKNTLFCSRDRFGVKPFYYRITKSYFAVASEIKQFTTLPDWEAVLNRSKAIDFISRGIFDHTDETLFNGVKQLKGGHNLTFNLQDYSFIIDRWYNLGSAIKPYQGNFEAAKEDFKKLFQSAVKLRLRSDVKVGSCLSGGLDSTSIVCTVNELLRQENKQDIQETVTACSHEKKYDEQVFADKVIKATSVKAHKVYPDLDELFSKLDELIWHQDEPFTSSSIFAQWSVFKEARKNNLIVMLDGQGADESLAGYPPFHDAYLTGLLKQLNFAQILKETQSLRLLKNYNVVKRWQFLLKFILPQVIADKLASNSNKFLSKSANEEKARYKPVFKEDLKEMSLDQLLISNLPMLLHYEDRNSMAHSIESRVPFLDYRLVEFILSLPDNYKINEGQTKYIMRESLSDILPQEIKNRHDKMGFVTPETIWIQKNAEQVKQHLQSATEAMESLIDKEQVLTSFEKLVSSNIDINIGSVFFRILTLHRWLLKFNVKIAA
ncbi:asparagine synthase (glutamine-hydrolyzing) [Pontibacter vulgaris]|uniref:asparagine synthase (glutamine-hydrolyzing) n=1 Tax=Pontibacter vulgaris TaxID=2905679 RepID=UPI001FA81457|nr:asparagine synthase (glutamine-hydrolyzing) [Pontibacter vulgaris]